MRVLVTADLHYDITRSRTSAAEMARRMAATPADALVLVGDTAGADLDLMRQCLRLFAPFAGRKLLVPGNHCLWCRAGETSIDRYERLLPEVCAVEGFSVLDHGPVILEQGPLRLGLVGSIGWYDYAFAEPGLEIPNAFYQAKVAPGAANYYEEHRHLVDAHREKLTERHMEMGSRWMDGVHVRLGMADEDFARYLAQRLGKQLADISPQVTQIAAFLHHLPFAELVPTGRPDRFAFAAAFMGSPLLGQQLLACPKVSHVYCGHSHWSGDHQIGHLRVINVGSTYVQKKLEVLEL